MSLTKYDSVHINIIETPSDIELKHWLKLDIESDTVPGISLERLHRELLENKRGKPITIAILDRAIDTKHIGLKNIVWHNAEELVNGRDDDGNGYTDDMYGWNFLGSTDNGVSEVQWADCIRIIEKYKNKFEGKEVKVIDSASQFEYNNYKRALIELNQDLEEAKQDVEYAKLIRGVLTSTKKTMKIYFPDERYTLEDLDSLKKMHPNDSTLQLQILKRHNFMKYGLDEAHVAEKEWDAFNRINKSLNPAFEERKIQGDNPNDLSDRFYGNGEVGANTDRFTHGTRVAGGILNFSQDKKNDEALLPINIMPVVISAKGDIHPKDMALAIRYAVDNGAKIINLSIRLSYNDLWIENALKYAALNDVVIIKGAGNSNDDLDNPSTFDFPDDRDNNGNEFINNFVKVGASSYKLNNTLKCDFSSYGKENVDLFAPGEEIYTTFPGDKYDFEVGTSMSTIVTSGVAALLFSYYPTLTAPEVKHILMESSVKYDILVDVPTQENPEQQLPFSELSKSGGIVNAYNAILMAEAVVKAKKKN